MFMSNLCSFFLPDPDPDPWPENIPDPPGSGSETLVSRQQSFFRTMLGFGKDPVSDLYFNVCLSGGYYLYGACWVKPWHLC